jgi:metallophosphoesterase (TIGR00282 family)
MMKISYLSERARRKVLFVGDVTGDPGLDLVCARLPELREQHGLGAVIVNGENSAPDGAGMSAHALERLLAAGADVVTGGNHSWDNGDSVTCLAHPRVLRPFNVPDGYAGHGVVTIPVPGRALTVLNVADSDALRPTSAAPDECNNMLAAVEDVLDGMPPSDVIIDVHSQHVFTKQALAYALDGRVSAVLGTHTHEATLRLRRLPSGTALVTDVGMTGSQEGVMGFTPEAFVGGLRAGTVVVGNSTPTSGPAELSAVMLELDEDGRTTYLERVS